MPVTDRHPNGRERGPVVVGLSGGVDSAVAAALLREHGEVRCVTMLLAGDCGGARSCCSDDAVERARATARALGLAWRTLDLREEFHDVVVTPFVAQYLAGQTPNPCVACNRFRLRRLLDCGNAEGAAAVATGHYARVEADASAPRLLRARDRGKDQSYMLWQVDHDVLAALRLPLGKLSKKYVRRLARDASLPVADEPESQEVCFAPFGYRAALERWGISGSEGRVIDGEGRELGRHDGHWLYTVGQRRGLGIAGEQPLYVLERRAASNEVVVGPRQALRTATVLVGGVDDRGLDGARELTVQLRYRSAAVRVAGLERRGRSEVEITLAEPFEAAAPGQSAVFYDNDAVVGGGVITGQGACDSLRPFQLPESPAPRTLEESHG